MPSLPSVYFHYRLIVNPHVTDCWPELAALATAPAAAAAAGMRALSPERRLP